SKQFREAAASTLTPGKLQRQPLGRAQSTSRVTARAIVMGPFLPASQNSSLTPPWTESSLMTDPPFSSPLSPINLQFRPLEQTRPISPYFLSTALLEPSLSRSQESRPM